MFGVFGRGGYVPGEGWQRGGVMPVIRRPRGMIEQFSVECRKTKTKSFTTQPISNRHKTKTKTTVTSADYFNILKLKTALTLVNLYNL